MSPAKRPIDKTNTKAKILSPTVSETSHKESECLLQTSFTTSTTSWLSFPPTMPLPPPTPAPSLIQATAKISTSMVENWIWQSHLELKALMAWHNERYAEVKAPCENGALKAEIVLKSYKIIDALEKKLEGTLWSGIGKRILLDIIYRTPSWKGPAGYMLSISDRRGLVLRELRARLRERERTKQIVNRGKEDGAKNSEEIERERERQRRMMLEQWKQLNGLRLMGSAGEYDEGRRKFVDDMADPGPRLSEEFELVELDVGEEGQD